MKVLIVSLYHPETIRGGSQEVAYELFQGLKERPDITPYFLGSADHNDPALFKSGARITGFDGRRNEFLFLCHDYDYIWQRTPGFQRAESFREFLELIQPDVVHFHHFLTFGIDYISLARRALPQARIVFTAHEFLSICAVNGHMARKTDGALCRRASPVRCHQCLPERPPEHYFMREMWMKTHLAAVDAFTVPSRFMIGQFTAWGLDEAKFTHVPNGQDLPAPRGNKTGPRNRFGFFGQIVDVKGLQVLLRAVSLLRAEGFEDFAVEINGGNIEFASGAVRDEIVGFLAAEAELPFAERRVVFNGAYHRDELAVRLARVDYVVVPSLWWESFCLVVSEAWAEGRPVIASDVGGLAERITDGKDGLLFTMGDARALAATLRRAATEAGLWETLAAGITRPPVRDEMVDGFLAVYETDGATLKRPARTQVKAVAQ